MRLRVLGEEVPYARHLLAGLRDESTGLREFRRLLRMAGVLLALEYSRELEWEEATVKTPLARARELKLARQPLILAVLGAGLELAHGMLEVYEGAPLGLLAARRVEDPGGVRVEVSYSRLPPRYEGVWVVADPMLATATTVSAAVDEAKRRGATRIVVASVIASKPGVNALASRHPDAIVYTLAVDPELDSRFFIVPGLGDAGDRSLGVTPG